MRISTIALIWFALLLPAFSGTRALTFVHQPLTALGADAGSGIVVARVPVLTNAVPEGLLHHIASPNRLLQDRSAAVANSNILSMLDISLSADLVMGSQFLVTMDLSRVGDPSKHGVTLAAVVEATIGCINRTIVDTNLFFGEAQEVVWTLNLVGDLKTLKPFAHHQKQYRPQRSKRAEQGDAAQPATAVDLKSEGKEKPKSESERHSL